MPKILIKGEEVIMKPVIYVGGQIKVGETPYILAVCGRNGNYLQLAFINMGSGNRYKDFVEKPGRNPYDTGFTAQELNEMFRFESVLDIIKERGDLQ